MSDQPKLNLGTRGSPLALWQARRVQALLEQYAPEVAVTIVVIQTTGDRVLDKPLVDVGGKGIFTKEIEEALLDGRIDLAVHSYKDLPTVLPDGLAIACVPERESPYDAFFSATVTKLSDLPDAPCVATGSLRRRAQILMLRPQATVVDLRGNVNTRLQKFHDAEWDVMIMAHAAVKRMEWSDRIAGVATTDELLPAPAQGAIAIETRSDDPVTCSWLESIHDPATAVGVEAERTFLATLEGGCQVPIAAHAVVQDGSVFLEGLITTLDGRHCVRLSGTAPVSDAARLGQSLAGKVLDQGGAGILQTLREANASSDE